MSDIEVNILSIDIVRYGSKLQMTAHIHRVLAAFFSSIYALNVLK